jgi:hypothetical protein
LQKFKKAYFFAEIEKGVSLFTEIEKGVSLFTEIEKGVRITVVCGARNRCTQVL